jgi:syntaxin-binding protein 5
MCVDYSSIALFIGTNRGRVVTFKILPSQTGRYSAQFAGLTQISDDAVISIYPIHSDGGSPAYASGRLVAGLQSGHRVDGVLVVSTISSAHIFRPSHAKGASKSFDTVFCNSAAVARFENRGYALVGLFGDGTARAYSLPGLKEVGTARVSHLLDVKRFTDAVITSTGDVLGWTGPSEMALLNIWGANQTLAESHDRLYDTTKPPLPRPTISNLQWIAGTQYITPSDMDILIGGPGRPPSKRMLAEMKAQREEELQRVARTGRTGRSTPPQENQEGYWAYMQRQVQERTEGLGLTNDSMERTSESTSTWSDDISKYVAKQKRQAAIGFIGSKFGL